MAQGTRQQQLQREPAVDPRDASLDRPGARITGWSVVLEDQQSIEACGLNGDLLIVHGYPGSGKSRFVAALTTILVGTSTETESSGAHGGRLNWSSNRGAWTVERSMPSQAAIVEAPDVGRVADGDAGLAALLGRPGPLTELRVWLWDRSKALTCPLFNSVWDDDTLGASNGTPSAGKVTESWAEATVALELADIELANAEAEILRYNAVPPLANIEAAETAIVRLREALSLLPHTQREVTNASALVTVAESIDSGNSNPPRRILSVLQPVALFVTAVLIAGSVGLLGAQASTGAALTGLAAMLAGAVALISPPRQLRLDRLAREAERRLEELRTNEKRWKDDLGALESRVAALAATLHLEVQPAPNELETRALDVTAYREARSQADLLAIEVVRARSSKEALRRRCAAMASKAALHNAAKQASGQIQELANQLLSFASGGALIGLSRANAEFVLASTDGAWHRAASRPAAERALADLCLRVAIAVSALPGIAPLFPLIIDDLVLDPEGPFDQGVARILEWVTARVQVVVVTADEATAELLATQPKAAVSLLPRPSSMAGRTASA